MTWSTWPTVYQTLYHSATPAALMTPVVAHLSTLGDLLRPLLVNRARVGTLAGRLSFFDLQDSLAARAYYSLALEAARKTDDCLRALGSRMAPGPNAAVGDPDFNHHPIAARSLPSTTTHPAHTDSTHANHHTGVSPDTFMSAAPQSFLHPAVPSTRRRSCQRPPPARPATR